MLIIIYYYYSITTTTTTTTTMPTTVQRQFSSDIGLIQPASFLMRAKVTRTLNTN